MKKVIPPGATPLQQAAECGARPGGADSGAAGRRTDPTTSLSWPWSSANRAHRVRAAEARDHIPV